MDLRKRETENELQYIWRLGCAKDAGQLDMNWDELGNVINENCREDETQYRTSAAYRKPYQYTRMFYEAGVFNNLSEDDYIAQLREEKHELRRIKQQMFDERTALNKILREQGRSEENVSKLEKLIKENGKCVFPAVKTTVEQSDKDLIIALSDFHLGINAKNYFGTYNAEIAAARLRQYAEEIVRLKNLYNAENAYLILLGDMISGSIHMTTQLENRENVIEQVQKSAELISAFTYELSRHFTELHINSVAGNHSRISFKDQVLRSERLDDIITWYMKAKLSHINNILFDDNENIDYTIGQCVIRGKSYLLVHGDHDSFSESGISRLVMLLGFKPEAVLFGHKHKCSYDEIANIKLIRSGSFIGTVDDYTVSKRLSGHPSQMVCVVTKDGVQGFHPIALD